MTHVWPFNRDYGSAVMYETGKILYVGGGGYTGGTRPIPSPPRPTATAETIDLNARPRPHWTSTDPMHFPRRHLNATILPDGQVLVTGGTSARRVQHDLGRGPRGRGVGPDDRPLDAARQQQRSIAAYHSVSLLLPDGTVLHGASGDANDARQRGRRTRGRPTTRSSARPTCSRARGRRSRAWRRLPWAMGRSSRSPRRMPTQITEVRWIRLGSVTHAFDADQRANTLTFTPSAASVQVTAPPNGKPAPPGHYLLFILNRNGVPSVGKVIKVQ